MKYIILLLLSITFCQIPSAQECKYRKNAKDEFTGDQLKMTKWQTIINHAGLMKNVALHLSLVTINEENFVELKYEAKQSKSKSMGFLKRTAKVFFKMDNGDVAELAYAGDESYTFAKRDYKRSSSGKASYVYDLTCKFHLSDENMATLTSGKASKIRMVLDKETIEMDILEKLKAPLLGFPHRGLKPKKFAPQSYFKVSMSCL